MAQFNTVAALCHMLPKALRQKVRAVSSVQARIAAFEWNLSGAAHTARSSHTPLPVPQNRFTATLMWSRRSSEHLNLLKHRHLLPLILHACSFQKFDDEICAERKYWRFQLNTCVSCFRQSHHGLIMEGWSLLQFWKQKPRNTVCHLFPKCPRATNYLWLSKPSLTDSMVGWKTSLR